MKTITKFLLIPFALLFLAAPAWAGGWAVVTLDTLPPGEIEVNETIQLSFMVRQHGERPLHFLDDRGEFPLKPILWARNDTTGETLQVEAVPAKEVGRFTVEIAFPGSGVWEWSLRPEPLVGELELAPVTVLTAVTTPEQSGQTAVAPTNETTGLRTGLRGLAAVLLILAAVSFRRRIQS